MNQSLPFETITKLEAAERQLRVAIRLFFERRDPIAIHTLATAAQEILRALAQPRGIKGIYEHADALIRPDKKKELIDHLRKAQNFFTHAAKDPGEKLDFFYEATQFYLFDDVLLWTPANGGNNHVGSGAGRDLGVFLLVFGKIPRHFYSQRQSNPTGPDASNERRERRGF